MKDKQKIETNPYIVRKVKYTFKIRIIKNPILQKIVFFTKIRFRL